MTSETTPRTVYADATNAPVAGIDVKTLVAVRTMLTAAGDTIAADAISDVQESSRQARAALLNGTDAALEEARQRAALKVMARLGFTCDELHMALTLTGNRTTAELRGLSPDEVTTYVEDIARIDHEGEETEAFSVLTLLEAMWPDIVMEAGRIHS